MKLPGLSTLKQKDTGKPFEITIHVRAASEREAAEMQQAIQCFISHFSLAEMKSAAQKLKNPINRKMIKTFL